jgi:DNA modification methylase
MHGIPDQSIDMVLCDLPYGMTQCKWDTVIPLEPLWEQYKRIVKPNGAIVLFAMQPFASTLISSNPKMYRYEWIWHKPRATGFLNAKKAPLRAHENILVFSQSAAQYYPIMWQQDPSMVRKHLRVNKGTPQCYGAIKRTDKADTGERYPQSILKIPTVPSVDPDVFHPTQKPVPLCEYLIKTYTKEGETVLDNTMGSGTTGVACVNTGRNFIGFELEKKYYDFAAERINKAFDRLTLSLMDYNKAAFQESENGCISGAV